jgi:hypothetical protein
MEREAAFFSTYLPYLVVSAENFVFLHPSAFDLPQRFLILALA